MPITQSFDFKQTSGGGGEKSFWEEIGWEDVICGFHFSINRPKEQLTTADTIFSSSSSIPTIKR